MKKQVIIAAVAAVAIVAGIVVSCAKDNTADLMTTTSNQISAPKHAALIATRDLKETWENEELQLAFNKESFLSYYQNVLQKETGHSCVAENVKAFMYELNSSEETPLLQISSYDVTDDKYSNVYLMLQQDTAGDVISYYSTGDTTWTLKCTGTGVCSSYDACYPKIILGSLDCSPCITTMGTCTRDMTVTISPKQALSFLE